MKKLLKRALKLISPTVLGDFILYWVYRDFDFSRVDEVLQHDTNWWWMLLSFLLGVLARVFCGWWWRQTSEPLDIFPRRSDCVNAISISCAASLVIPRIGEVNRCGVLAKYDNVSFVKSLGTAVTGRPVDTLTTFPVTGTTALLQMPVFVTFLENMGTKIPLFAYLLTSIWFYIILFCFIGAMVLLYYLRKTLFFYERVKGLVSNIWEEIISLKGVRNIPLFTFYILAIWAYYFSHLYFAFCCFALTAHLGILAVLVTFIGDTFAVIVPTPNGAGPWHFVIMRMMILYGVNATGAEIFALVVHGIQTLSVVLLGVYGLVALPFTDRQRG